jgi:hypothetical protein
MCKPITQRSALLVVMAMADPAHFLVIDLSLGAGNP